MNEATARIKINKLLEAAGWRFLAVGLRGRAAVGRACARGFAAGE